MITTALDFTFWEFACRAFFIYAVIFHIRRRQFLQAMSLALLCELLVSQLYAFEALLSVIWRSS